jgi:hypothetical protein
MVFDTAPTGKSGFFYSCLVLKKVDYKVNKNGTVKIIPKGLNIDNAV